MEVIDSKIVDLNDIAIGELEKIFIINEMTHLENIFTHYRNNISAHLIAGLLDDEVVSLAVYTHSNEVIKIEGIFTIDKFRGYGYASQLVDIIMKNDWYNVIVDVSTEGLSKSFWSKSIKDFTGIGVDLLTECRIIFKDSGSVTITKREY